MRARRLWALVPAKGFDRGKSRLGTALSDEARASFARGLFDHVLGVLARTPGLEGILVATDSAAVATAARQHGASVRMDAPGGGALAGVVDAGLAALQADGADGALVLMADLPRLEAGDVQALLARLYEHDAVIVRAQDGLHTNALALAPPARLPTAFGRADSFQAHVTSARAAGLRLAIVEDPHIAFDVDGPEDHARLTLPRPPGTG